MARLFFTLFLSIFGFLQAEKPIIIVSVAPYKSLVEQVAQGAVEVFLIVPPGVSAHTFEPTPKDMMRAAKASLWFTLGETFEKKAIGAISANNEKFRTIDLTKGVELIQGNCHCHRHASDLHLWLSPKELKVQAATIAEGLATLLPEHDFKTPLQNLHTRLDALDQEVRQIVSSKKATTLLVSHPAFGYFCRDYGFKQLSIEVEGKDPTPKRLHDLLNLAKEERISKVYAEPQYSDKGAQVISKEIGARIVVVDPYKEDVMANLVYLAKEFVND